ncbi:MAG: hypothetical protein A3K19_04845 [Lentisphaerae bacterium RIFOXYB12_FULL_65_16]|nr:MAG: hypothetical protein A3K18_15565 [Lentisphaerae bacterium RIFOXYA12_64_32]OGV89718.1 MAG: hypothetical protein A3K19_04845 [Lentisphaerae bacterium RIFOXYB12_FULL_65_16]
MVTDLLIGARRAGLGPVHAPLLAATECSDESRHPRAIRRARRVAESHAWKPDEKVGHLQG